MTEKRQKSEQSAIDPREFDLPETIYSRDVENRVFQGIVVKALSNISGIGLLEGTVFDNVLGRIDKVKGIATEQDPKTHSIKIRIEVRIQYGMAIPKKAEEIQSAVVEAVTQITGVRVSEIHVVFKELLSENPTGSELAPPVPDAADEPIAEEFEDEF